MDNEKLNEHMLWRSRLEEPGALPGIGLTDKEAAWDKLYDRLRETETPRRSLTWLWTAAACLLLVLVPAAILLKDRRPSLPIPGKIPVAPTAIAKPHTPLSREPVHPGAITKPQPPAHSLVSAPPHPTRREKPAPAKRPYQPVSLALAVASTTRPAIPDLMSPPNPDQSKSLALAAAQPAIPKKVQRVVHINELGPPQSIPAMTGLREKPGRLRIAFGQQGTFGQQETFRPATTSLTEHPILSLKPSQNP